MSAPALLAVTDARTSLADLVTLDAMVAGRSRGVYVAVCDAEVVASSLTAEEVRALPPLPGVEGGAVSAGVPVGVTDSQVAVLLRQAQWALDDAAHELPAGRATVGRRVELAGALEALAVVLRSSVPEAAGHPAGELGDGQRRGWCLAGCGCVLEVPPGGAVFVDCAVCEPSPTRTPADHRCSESCTPAPGDRPDPA